MVGRGRRAVGESAGWVRETASVSGDGTAKGSVGVKEGAGAALRSAAGVEELEKRAREANHPLLRFVSALILPRS
jgi:hypothetical protein